MAALISYAHAVSAPNIFCIVDVSTGKKICELPTGPERTPGAFSADNSIFATALPEAVQLFNATTGRPIRACNLSSGCTEIVFSPDGKTLAGGDADGWIRLWDVATGELKNSSPFHAGPVLAVGQRPDGSRLATIGEDSIINWDAATGKLVEKTPLPRQIQSAAVTADGKQAALQTNADLFHWNLEEKPQQLRAFANAFDRTDLRVRAIESETSTVAFSGSYDGTFELKKAKARMLSVPSHLHGEMDFSPDRTLLVLAGGIAGQHIPSLSLVTPLTGQVQASFSEDVVYSAVAFHPGGVTLAGAVKGHKSIRLFDLRTGGLARSIDAHQTPVQRLAWRGDGKWLASLGEDGALLVHDMTGEKETLVKEIQLGEVANAIRRIAFTPDGRHLVTTNANGTVFVLRVAGGEGK